MEDEIQAICPIGKDRIKLALSSTTNESLFMKLTQTLAFILLGLVVSDVNAEEKIFLGDLKPMKAKFGFPCDMVIRNGKASGSEFLVDGKPVQKGLMAHTDSEVVFAIPSGVRKFVAVGTMPNYKRPSRNVNGHDVLDGSWSYEVIIDGVQVYESEPLCAYVKKEIPIQVEIPNNAQHITLKTHMLGDGNADHAIWAEPYFIKP